MKTLSRSCSLPLIVVAVLSRCLAAPVDPASRMVAREPYLQMATANSICIVWRTDRPIAPVVRYGRSPQQLEGAVRGQAIVTRLAPRRGVAGVKPQLHSAPEGSFQYEATVCT
jgi:hypothetical protein